MEKFIIMKDKDEAQKLITMGYKPLTTTGGFYIFENNAAIKMFCKEQLNATAYVFTNKMFF